MNKLITFFFAVGTMVTGLVTPQEAEALKIKIEPSISFYQSHSRHYHQPRYAPVYYQQPVVQQYYYYQPQPQPQPVTYVQTQTYYSAPAPVVYYPPVRHSRSTTVQYGTTFRFR